MARNISFITATSTDFEITGPVTDQIIWAPASGKRIFLMSVEFTVDSATTVEMSFEGGSNPVWIKKGDFAANSGIDCVYRWPVAGDTDECIVVSVDTGCTIKGVLTGLEQE